MITLQCIIFNGIQIYVFEIFLNFLPQARHVSSSSSNLCHHFDIPPSFVSFFHFHYVFMESLALFFTFITEAVWKSIQVAVKKLHFDVQIDAKNPEISKHVFLQFLFNFQLYSFQQVLYNLHK